MRRARSSRRRIARPCKSWGRAMPLDAVFLRFSLFRSVSLAVAVSEGPRVLSISVGSISTAECVLDIALTNASNSTFDVCARRAGKILARTECPPSPSISLEVPVTKITQSCVPCREPGCVSHVAWDDHPFCVGAWYYACDQASHTCIYECA